MLNIPNSCPVCESKLERVNDQLFCRNDNCDAKSTKKLQHFVKTMKIKGLGPASLEKLNLDSINDLYKLSLEEISSILGEKIGTKLYDEIAKSKTVPLATYIQSFGIPLIGNSATTKLAKHTDSIWNIDETVCNKAGLGKVATSNLLQWIKKNEVNYSDLPVTPIVNSNEVKTEELFKIAITGKLNDFSSRTKAKDFLANKGIAVMSTVTKNVKYLITDQEDSSSSSSKKATTLGIPIITMNDLLNIINGDK
jgi:DNA ligase (NAD+)